MDFKKHLLIMGVYKVRKSEKVSTRPHFNFLMLAFDSGRWAHVNVKLYEEWVSPVSLAPENNQLYLRSPIKLETSIGVQGNSGRGGGFQHKPYCNNTCLRVVMVLAPSNAFYEGCLASYRQDCPASGTRSSLLSWRPTCLACATTTNTVCVLHSFQFISWQPGKSNWNQSTEIQKSWCD